MMYYNQTRGRRFWVARAIFIPLAIAAGIFIFGSIVMLLWNGILPAVFGIGTITFWQALGILVLSKILFSSFRGGNWHRHHRYDWRNRWMHLSPEEREKMRAEWKERCRPAAKTEENQ